MSVQLKCQEGFVFEYFAPDKTGRFRKVKPNLFLRSVENKILRRIRKILKNRPDLLEWIACLEDGLEIKIFWTEDIDDSRYSGGRFVGRTTREGNRTFMEFATGETLYGLRIKNDGYEVVSHELAHLLEFLSEEEGVLPGWSCKQIRQYKRARRDEKNKLRKGTSPLAEYALKDNTEFLAVLTETFFEKPDQLLESNRTLYALMSAYFQTNPLSITQRLSLLQRGITLP